MKVTIGITTKNRAAILPKAIQSALDQSYANKEIVLFNDGSTDDTAMLKSSFPQVRWIDQPKSIGLLGARNIMMQESDSDFFVSLDDDAWFLEGDEIALAVEAMKTDSKLAAIAFDILQPDTRRFQKVARTSAIPTNIFIGCGHLLRLSAVREAGYYVPFPLRYGHEEKDLGIRLIDLGYHISFLPGVHVWHEYTSLSRNIVEQNHSFVVNDLIFSYRRVPTIYLIPVLGRKMWKKLVGREKENTGALPALRAFFALLGEERKNIRRVNRASYIRYRQISKAYLAYLKQNAQHSQ